MLDINLRRWKFIFSTKMMLINIKHERKFLYLCDQIFIFIVHYAQILVNEAILISKIIEI